MAPNLVTFCTLINFSADQGFNAFDKPTLELFFDASGVLCRSRGKRHATPGIQVTANLLAEYLLTDSS